MSSLTRRRFLSTTALAGAGAGALLLGAKQAAAFAVKPMDAETHALYLSACGRDAGAYHQQLLIEAKAKLAGSADDADIEAAIAALTCPICGCRLAG